MTRVHDGSDPAFTVTYAQQLTIEKILSATPFSGDVLLHTGRQVCNAGQLITILEELRDELARFITVHRQLSVDKRSLESLLDGGADLLNELLDRAKKLRDEAHEL